MRRASARVALAATVVAVAAVVVLAAPAPSLLRHVVHPRAWVAQVGADRATLSLATAALWLLACWVAVALLLCGLGTAPRLAGSAAHRVGQRVGQLALPACLRRLVVTATGIGIGVGIALTPVGAAAATTAPAASVAATPAPAWPTSDPLPTPAWPTQRPAHAPPAPPGTPAPPAPAATPARPAQAPGQAPAHTATQPPAHGRTVVVRPGDTLWSIAAEHPHTITAAPASRTPSARAVARSWPAWFAANRPVIGDDPNLITPGEHLRMPATPPQIGQP